MGRWKVKSRWVTLAAVALVLLWCARPSVSAAFKNVQVAQTPPAFSLKDLAGKEWKSAEVYARGATAVMASASSPGVLLDEASAGHPAWRSAA